METQSKKGSKLKRGIQKKAFTAWANSILERKGSSKIKDLFKSLRNGLLLGKLIEILSDEKVRLGPAKSRQQSLDNVEICLDFLKKQRVSTRGIDSEDIVDGCPDTTLELMWAIITGLYIDKKELLEKGEKKTVEEALLLWAQDKTKGYRDVRVKDFTSSSWKDGLAFLALISAHRPKLIQFKDFHNDERRHNLKTAFDEAEDELGIPSLLDVEDMMKSQVDERSVASYVACFYKRFTDKRRRRSRSESRSDESDTSSSSETSRSSGSRTKRERRSRSTSKTRRPSRNEHKQRESSQSRSSSSSSNGSRKSRRGSQNESARSRSSSSTESSSSKSSNTRRGSKNGSGRVRSRSSSSSGSTPEIRKNRKGLRNMSGKRPRKSNNCERNGSDGKRRSKISDSKRSTDRSLSRTRESTDWRSHSLERKHSPDRSLSRNKHGKNNRGRSCSNSPDRRGVKNKGNRGVCERSPGSSRNKERPPGSSRNRDRSPGSNRNKSPGLPGLSRNRDWSPGSSRNKERPPGSNRDRSPGSSRNRNRSPGLSRNRDWSPGSSRNKHSYKAHVRESRSRTGSSSSQEDEYHQFGGSQYHTLSKKQRGKYLKSHQPSLDDWSRIRREIFNLERHPGLSKNESAGDDMDSIKKFFLGKQLNSQPIPLTTVPFNPSPVRFEWQFQDEHGVWKTYGQPNSAGSGSNASTTTSNDIENYFVANPNSSPVLVLTQHNRYILDFQGKTQKNLKTNVKRPIRRIPKQSANITPLNAHTILQTVLMNSASVSFEWQFQDEHGSWITYGKPNSAGNASHITTTCSDDIEMHYASNPANPTPLTIQSNNNTLYLLDLAGMTQTNQKTSVQRPIRRIQKQPPNITPVNLSRGLNLGAVSNANFLHEWQFEDEHGTWITYGLPNSAGNVAHITTTSSDDIENHYASNPANPTPLTIKSKGNVPYDLDLKAMTQTNTQTSVQRKIRRVPKASPSTTTAPKGSTFVWSFKDEHGNWVKYGKTSSSNEATSATTTTSDDIETKYARNPTASLEIASGHHKYIIDFNAMTQTNINTKVVRDIRRQLVTPSDLPSNWTPMTASDKGLRVVALSSTDTEYIHQVAFVKKTLPSNFNITKVFRIQNEHLWMDFVSRKKRLKKRNPQIKYKEVYLFHGTNPQHVQSICAENLDFRLNGTNGTVYGKGTYFATSAAYSANYAGSGSTKLMFIVKVLIGHYTVGNTNLRRPPKDASGVFYDATVDNQANPTIYVKYDNTEYYPEYYIEFT